MSHPPETLPEFILAGVVMKRLISAAETGGSFCLFENTSQGPSKTPIHFHDGDDETIYMIEGELQAETPAGITTIGAGEAVFLKRGIPHQLSNPSGKPNRYILLCTPSGFDAFLEVAGKLKQPGDVPGPPTAEDIARLREAAPKFGINLLPDWPAENVQTLD